MWLVKSGGVVLGPFSFEELVDKIQSKEVVLHDELLAPLSRWKYVREQPEFAEIVYKIRHHHNPDREDTQTASSTEELSIGEGKFTAVYADEPEGKRDEVTTKRVYANLSEDKVQHEVDSSARRGWIFVLFIILSIGVYIWWDQNPPLQTITNPSAQQDLVYKARELLRVGDYARATQYFSKVLSLSPSDIEGNLTLAMLMITQERQTVEARRILQKFTEKQLSPKEMLKWRTIFSLAAITDNDWDEALKQSQDAILIDGTFEPALLNLATIYQHRGQYDQAKANFQKVVRSKEYGPMAQILSLRMLLDKAEKASADKSNYVDIGAQLIKFARDVVDFRQEAYFLASYAFVMAGDSDQALFAAEKALDIDPRATEQHLHNPLVSLRDLDWNNLTNLCPKIIRTNPQLPRMRALNGFCLAKSGHWVEARKEFEEALAMNDKDSLVRAVFAAFLIENSREKEARSVLLLSSNERFDLPLIMSARVCERETDPECASDYWQQLLKLNSRSLAGLVGMAEELLAYRPEEAQTYLRKGLEISANYIPLLKLQKPVPGEKL